MILVDTDVLIWVLRGEKSWIENFEMMVNDVKGSVFITPVQVAEIYAGIRRKETQKVEKFLSSLRLVDLDGEMSKLAGGYMNEYGKSHSVTLADALVAAVTVMKRFRLWTANKKHYPMLDSDDFYK